MSSVRPAHAGTGPDAPALKPPADFKSRAPRFAGSYRFTRHNSSTIEKLLALAATLTEYVEGTATTP